MHDVEDRGQTAIIINDDTPLQLSHDGKLSVGANYATRPKRDRYETFTIREWRSGDLAMSKYVDVATWVAAASGGELEYNPNV